MSEEIKPDQMAVLIPRRIVDGYPVLLNLSELVRDMYGEDHKYHHHPQSIIAEVRPMLFDDDRDLYISGIGSKRLGISHKVAHRFKFYTFIGRTPVYAEESYWTDGKLDGITLGVLNTSLMGFIQKYLIEQVASVAADPTSLREAILDRITTLLSRDSIPVNDNPNKEEEDE